MAGFWPVARAFGCAATLCKAQLDILDQMMQGARDV
jgi:hypothetical protein